MDLIDRSDIKKKKKHVYYSYMSYACHGVLARVRDGTLMSLLW